MEMRVQYVPGKYVEAIGFDMGRRNRQMAVLAEKTESANAVLVAVRMYGHKYWGGVGMTRNYAPARTCVFRLTRRSGDPKGNWRADEVLSIPSRWVREDANSQ